MTLHENLESIYSELVPGDDPEVDVYVVPLIRYKYKKSDYLYLLYKIFIEDSDSRIHIHSTSVWQHWKFVWSALRNRNTILHYHWLECTDLKSLAGMAYKILCIFLFSKMGGKIVWTVHNKIPHDRSFNKLNMKLGSFMARKADLLHVHCNFAAKEISKLYDQPLSKFRVIPHPEYPAEFMPRKQAIKKLNQIRDFNLRNSDQIFLMLGNISAYKQIEQVVQMFTDLPEWKKLVIVGPVKKGQMPTYRKISEICDHHTNIKLHPHFIPEDHVPLYHNACDCVLFNYREILTSGGVALAESYKRPIIAPDKGCIPETGSDRLLLFNTQKELLPLITNFSSDEDENA